MDYSPFIMVTMVEMLEKMETTPAAPRRSFPLQSAAPDLCFVVLCFCGAPFRKPSGTIFIVVFRSRRRHGDENGRHRSNEGGERCSHAARESGCVGPPKILLRLSFMRFIVSYALFLTKNDPRKILGHLDVVSVPETSKYRK